MCASGGNCTSPGVCICTSGWDGPSCETGDVICLSLPNQYNILQLSAQKDFVWVEGIACFLIRIARAYQNGLEISVKLVIIATKIVALMTLHTCMQLCVKLGSVKMEEHVCIQTSTAHAQMGGKETHVTQVN